MHPLDASVQFLKPFTSSEHCLAAPIGESGGLAFSQGILTFSGAFADLFTSVPTLETSLIPLDMSAWLPMPSITLTLCFMSLVPRYILAPSP